jgi:hypothetical protein
MNDDDVPRGEMPHLPSWRRHGEPTDPAPLDELVGDGQVSPAVSSEWQPVSELLQAAAGSASAAELTVDNAALAAFRRAHLGAPARRPLVRPRMISTLLTGKIAAALACAAVGITGAAGAAFAGVLPTHIQNAAHDTIGAPRAHHAAAESAEASHSAEPSHSADPSESPEASDSPEASESPEASHSPKPSESPEASESEHVSATSTASPAANAAFGLCQAWSNAVKHGLTDQVGFRDKLAGLAGGIANISTFCASVKHTDGDDSEGPSPSSSVSPTATATSGEHGDGHDGNGKSGSDGQDHSKSGAFPAPSPAPQGGGHD